MLPQLAEGLALALEPLVAAVCSRHILTPRVQCEWSGKSHDTRDTSDTSHQACGHNSGYDPEARGFESLADSSLV